MNNRDKKDDKRGLLSGFSAFKSKSYGGVQSQQAKAPLANTRQELATNNMIKDIEIRIINLKKGRDFLQKLRKVLIQDREKLVTGRIKATPLPLNAQTNAARMNIEILINGLNKGWINSLFSKNRNNNIVDVFLKKMKDYVAFQADPMSDKSQLSKLSKELFELAEQYEQQLTIAEIYVCGRINRDEDEIATLESLFTEQKEQRERDKNEIEALSTETKNSVENK